MNKVFNGWTIGECIGEGAFGKVYQITREDFGHTYHAALKVIEIPQSQSEVEGLRNDGMQENEIEEYFQGMIEDIVNEFVLMSKLKGNSNIVSYEDHTVIKKENGFGWTIYIRMELLTPLFTHIRQKKMTIRDVIQLGIDICTALEVCQKYNIIHRDIKPENIFISDIGVYKLGDFGIARQLERNSTDLSQKGTIPYMAPEVYKRIEYNSTVDVYSLGLVLYRFLNKNRSPFLPPAPKPIKYSDKQKADIMRMSGQPLPKPCYADGRLAEIVLKACEYNPKNRYETATEMKTALSAVLYTETERSAAISEMVTPPQAGVDPSRAEDLGTVYLFQEEKKQQDEISFIPKLSAEETQLLDKDQDFAETGVVEEVKRAAGASINIYGIEKAGLIQAENGMEKESKKRIFAFLRHIPLKAKVIFIGVLVVGIVLFMLASNESGRDYVVDSNYDDSETEEINITELPTSTETTEQPTSDKVLVPDLLNISREEAEKKAREMKLKVAISDQYSDKINKGIVLNQEPAKEQEVAMGTTIKVVISKGVQMVKMPNVLKKSRSKAKALIKKAGLKCKIEKAYSNSYKKGLVMKQSIKKGKKIKARTIITVTISKGRRTKKPTVQAIPTKQPIVKKIAEQKPKVTEKMKAKATEKSVSKKNKDPFADSSGSGSKKSTKEADKKLSKKNKDPFA